MTSLTQRILTIAADRFGEKNAERTQYIQRWPTTCIGAVSVEHRAKTDRHTNVFVDGAFAATIPSYIPVIVHPASQGCTNTGVRCQAVGNRVVKLQVNRRNIASFATWLDKQLGR